MSVMLYPCLLCVALVNVSVCFVCCVLDSICELFGYYSPLYYLILVPFPFYS